MSKGYGTQRPIRLVVGIADGRLKLALGESVLHDRKARSG